MVSLGKARRSVGCRMHHQKQEAPMRRRVATSLQVYTVYTEGTFSSRYLGHFLEQTAADDRDPLSSTDAGRLRSLCNLAGCSRHTPTLRLAVSHCSPSSRLSS